MSTKHLHNVFFKLHDSSPEKIRELIKDSYTYLAPQDGIESFSAGARSTGYQRDVNDQEYHVALTILFRNSQDHDAYQVDSRHNEYVDRNKENWAGARVFDSVVAED